MGIAGPELDLSGANHIFYVDIDPNPKIEEDCTKMIYRPNQKQKVVVHRMITKAMVEERMLMEQNVGTTNCQAWWETLEKGDCSEKRNLKKKMYYSLEIFALHIFFWFILCRQDSLTFVYTIIHRLWNN